MKKSTQAKTKKEDRAVTVEAQRGENATETMSRVLVSPYLRHGIVAQGIADKMMGKVPGEPRFDDYGQAIKSRAEQVSSGDLELVNGMLTAQAHSLDAIFTEMARRSAMNMGEYLDASERYMRLALKAQANSRATLEALARLHQPREQTVRHVHVNEGGQALIADQFHNHTGGKENAKSSEQCHATAAAGQSPSLPSPNPIRNGVPVPGGKGKAPMPDARRHKSGPA